MFWNVKICICKYFKLFWVLFTSKSYVLDLNLLICLSKNYLNEKQFLSVSEKNGFCRTGVGGGVGKLHVRNYNFFLHLPVLVNNAVVIVYKVVSDLLTKKNLIIGNCILLQNAFSLVLHAALLFSSFNIQVSPNEKIIIRFILLLLFSNGSSRFFLHTLSYLDVYRFL